MDYRIFIFSRNELKIMIVGTIIGYMLEVSEKPSRIIEQSTT